MYIICYSLSLLNIFIQSVVTILEFTLFAEGPFVCAFNIMFLCVLISHSKIHRHAPTNTHTRVPVFSVAHNAPKQTLSQT